MQWLMPLRIGLNASRRWLWRWMFSRVVFGERSQGRWLAHTRIAPSTLIDHEDRLHLSDHVYIGPLNWIEASAGVVIEEGVQVTSHTSIITHSSHRAMRILGRHYVHHDFTMGPPPGWISAPVHIGAYSFIGPHVVLEPGTRLGKGCVVRAGSIVRGEFADFSIVQGQPARVVGDTRTQDETLLMEFPEYAEHRRRWAGRWEPPSA